MRLFKKILFQLHIVSIHIHDAVPYKNNKKSIENRFTTDSFEFLMTFSDIFEVHKHIGSTTLAQIGIIHFI